MLKWLSFALAVLVVALLLAMLNDLRLQVRRVTVTVNQKLPEILEKTRTSADTLAQVSNDIKGLRDLAGVPPGVHDEGLVKYADGVLDLIEASGGTVGTKALLGKGLKDPIPAGEWAAGARKEALWLTFRAKSRHELLTRLCETKFGSAWQIQLPGGGEPVPLEQWVKANHPAGNKTE
jgi:hypothetical protein